MNDVTRDMTAASASSRVEKKLIFSVFSCLRHITMELNHYEVVFDYFYTLDFSGILRETFQISDVSFAVFRTKIKYKLINTLTPLYIIDLVTFFVCLEAIIIKPNHNHSIYQLVV